ncbi:MAG: T9SS type A sorting domain-containing protein, partial [Bacteroidetes bacterium]|nr:T9SS type A sorting domain-containing protein [Bacteroidota bacterium]
FMDSGAAYVVKWDGSTWAKVGYAKGPNSPNAANAIYSLCTDTAGNLYAAHGNAINRGGKYEWDIYKWDGKVWSIVGGTTGLKANKEATTITCDRDGNLYAGGRFTNDSGKCYIAKWDGTKWTELGKGGNELNANSLIWSVNADKKGNIYTAGTFTNSFGKIYVAKWNGTKWTTVGTDSSFENKNKGQIISVKTDDAGNVIIAGYYKNNKNEFYVGKYNDTSWSQVGKGFNANAYTMYVSSKNEILVGGNFIDSTNKNFLAMQLSQVVTAIENINTHAGYAIYPNPAHDFISINTKDIAPNTPYQIMDVMGKIVAKGTLGATTNIIDIAALNSGVYFITINGGLVQPVKFIKE